MTLTQESAAQNLNAIMKRLAPVDPSVCDTLMQVASSPQTLRVYMEFVTNPRTVYSMKDLEKRLQMPEGTTHRAKNRLLRLKLIKIGGVRRKPNGVDIGGPDTTLYSLNTLF
jgi:hypothetical protein